jgi:tRNA(fMet)-specific endonuclease VapC
VTNRYLLDTGIASAYLDNDLDLRRRLKGVLFFLSIITFGELYFGAFNSTTKERNLPALRKFLEPYTPLPCDHSTAERFGLIATNLQKQAIRLPQNDIWMAAQAMRYNMILITRDDDFSHIDGLKFEKWQPSA